LHQRHVSLAGDIHFDTTLLQSARCCESLQCKFGCEAYPLLRVRTDKALLMFECCGLVAAHEESTRKTKAEVRS
jgi:hypothetical protein